MYILTNSDNRIIMISKTLSYTNNNDYVVNEGKLIIVKELISNVYEKNEEIDKKYNSSKYCYTNEQGFYINPDWKPYYPIEERVAALEDAVNSLLIGGLE